MRQLAESSVQAMLRGNVNFEQLKAEVTRFCDELDAVRRFYGAGIKVGPPRRRLLLQVFIGELLGVAKRASVYPSTPGRAILPTKPPPPFYRFMQAALMIGQEVVRSSSLTDRKRQAALSVFTVATEEQRGLW